MITQPDTLTPARIKSYLKWNAKYEKANIPDDRTEAAQAMERLRRLLNRSHADIMRGAQP